MSLTSLGSAGDMNSTWRHPFSEGSKECEPTTRKLPFLELTVELSKIIGEIDNKTYSLQIDRGLCEENKKDAICKNMSSELEARLISIQNGVLDLNRRIDIFLTSNESLQKEESKIPYGNIFSIILSNLRDIDKKLSAFKTERLEMPATTEEEPSKSEFESTLVELIEVARDINNSLNF